MVASRVEDLVEGWVQRSYLKRDGWWAQLVLDEFDFLVGWGLALVEVRFHQKGHVVSFASPARSVAIGFDPETNTIAADIVTYGASGAPRFLPLEQQVLDLVPGSQIPSRDPLTHAAIEENVRWWAQGLKQIAPEVL